MKRKINRFFYNIKRTFTIPKVLIIMLGTAILSFGLYNVHAQADVTEGGVLGMILLLHHWFHIPSGLASVVLDLTCYALAFKYLGKQFIITSLFSSISLSAFFSLWESFPPILPNLSTHPLIAAIIGGLFVGLGVGLVVLQGGSSGGDDALALSISKITKWPISKSYLITDLTVLLLSLSYIPVTKILCSLVTVTISSKLIEIITNYGSRFIKVDLEID